MSTRQSPLTKLDTFGHQSTSTDEPSNRSLLMRDLYKRMAKNDCYGGEKDEENSGYL